MSNGTKETFGEFQARTRNQCFHSIETEATFELQTAIEPKRTCAVDRDIDRSTCCGADIVWFESERYEDETGCTRFRGGYNGCEYCGAYATNENHTHSYDDDCCCDECEARR